MNVNVSSRKSMRAELTVRSYNESNVTSDIPIRKIITK